MIRCKCPQCQTAYELEDGIAGRKLRCGVCDSAFVAPAAAQPQAAPARPAAPQRNPAAYMPHAGPQKKAAGMSGLTKLCLGLGGAAALVAVAFLVMPRAPAILAAAPDVAAEAPAAPAVALQSGPLGGEFAVLLAKNDFLGIQDKLGAVLATKFAGGATAVTAALADPVMQAGLAQHELIRGCGTDNVAEIAKKEGGQEFLKRFLNDPAWIESFLASGPPAGGPAQALENLWLLYHHGKDLDRNVYRRLATALALQGGGMNRYRLVDRFNHVQRAHRALLLHASFDTLDVREMRYALFTEGNARDYQYLLDDRQLTIGDYFGACWACWYLGDNAYGDSVQGPLYYRPWDHAYGWKEATRVVGGVCGSLSHYGSDSARSHGVPSTPVGQPGHCAYVIRVGKEWPVAYNVTWPTSFSAPGWDGTGYATVHRLYEIVYQDRKRQLAASRLCWAARLQQDVARLRVRFLPGMRYALYRQNVGAGLPDFAKLTPDGSGVSEKPFDLASVQPANPINFGVVWEGALEVNRTGTAKFALLSDDSSRLSVDGAPALSAQCNRQEKELTLAAGRHPFRLEFSQGGGALNLAVEAGGGAQPGAWTDTYEEAVRAQPLNYGTWLEYTKALEGLGNAVPPEKWLELARRAARTFAPYSEAGWALVTRTLDKAIASKNTAERLALFIEFNRELRQEKADRFEGYPYDGILNWQADRLGNAAGGIEFFQRGLAIHTAKPPHDWIFGQVLAWGQSRFGNNPATAQPFANAMYAYFRSRGSAADPNFMRGQIQNGILAACQRGDLPTMNLWCSMSDKLLPPLQPGDLHMNSQQAAAFPKVTPIPGILLTQEATLSMSSSDGGSDRPISYRALLRGNAFGGFFHTRAELNPWVQVQLAGDSMLSGVIVVNRYEAAGEREVPLRISASTDAKTWTELATFTENKPFYRIELPAAKQLRAKYVRIERPEDKKRSEPFHLRGIMVYGKKLY